MKLRNKSGVTLIALIVTIIVLIIIAGISIATLTADNGILRQTDAAKVTQIEGTAREQVKLACAAMRLAIAEASAKDNSYSAVQHAKAIQEELLATIKADSTSLDENEGSWTSSGADNEDTEFTITYAGQDYKNACNDDKAEIVYTIGLSQRTIEITNEINTTLKDQNGNNVIFDIGSNEGTGSGSGEGDGSVSSETDIIPEQTLSFTADSNFDANSASLSGVTFLTEGETYTVVWDGIEYTCFAREIEYKAYDGRITYTFAGAVGNSGIFTLLWEEYDATTTESSTGEPFLISKGSASSSNSMIFLTDDASSEHTVRIYQKN